MHFVALILVTWLGFSAHAELVTCSFTEPFITMKVDATAKSVTVHEGVEDRTDVYPIVESTTENGVTKVTFGIEEELTVLEYYRDPKGGSDGMSDFLFPMTGKTRTGDTHELVGGCATPSEPAVNPYEAPVPGCYEVLNGQFEDGASYYSAIHSKIIQPLKTQWKADGLAEFLSSALVTRGYLELTFDVCRSLDDSLKN